MVPEPSETLSHWVHMEPYGTPDLDQGFVPLRQALLRPNNFQQVLQPRRVAFNFDGRRHRGWRVILYLINQVDENPVCGHNDVSVEQIRAKLCVSGRSPRHGTRLL